MSRVDEALRRRIIAAATSSAVSRAEVELELPECHKTKCKERHGDLDRAMGHMQHAIVEAIDAEMQWRTTTRPDVFDPQDSQEESAALALAVLLGRYRVNEVGTFAKAAQLIVDAYPELVDVFAHAEAAG